MGYEFHRTYFRFTYVFFFLLLLLPFISNHFEDARRNTFFFRKINFELLGNPIRNKSSSLFQTRSVSFPSLSSVREEEEEEEEEEVLFKRNRRRLLEKSRKSGWKRERSFPIKRDTHRFPIIPVLFTGKHGSPTVENRSLFSSSPYPPISYIIAEPRNRQFHVG